jgi:CRP-like cAMP-binding protein
MLAERKKTPRQDVQESVRMDLKPSWVRSGEGRSAMAYQKGQAIYSQGDAADAVYYVQKGKVKLSVFSRQGKEAVIAILETGDFLGEACLAGQALRTASATAMSDSWIIHLPKVSAMRMLQQEQAFSRIFLSHLLARNIRIEEDLVDHLFNSSEKRLARALLLLANFGRPGDPGPSPALNITQEMLAEMVGTTRPRISFFLNKFRKLGFIQYSARTLRVNSSLLTVVLHD